MRNMSLLEAMEAEQTDSPVRPTGWSVAQIGKHGLIITLDGLQIKLTRDAVEKFYDLIIDEDEGMVQTDTGFWIKVDANADDGTVIITPISQSTRIADAYPNGVLLDGDILNDIGVQLEEYEDEAEVVDSVEDEVNEGVKMAYRRSGKKVKRGFRVTSGIRKGRVVANMKTAHKPRAKASTRSKLRLARRKKKVIRVLKSKRTRKRSASKRVARLNALRK